MIRLFVYLLTGSALLVCCNFQALEITLQRHKSPRQLVLETGTTAQHLPFLATFNSGDPKPKPTPPFDNDTVALYTKYFDSDYYGIIGIGHPAQEFKVVFDTAWANTYVPSKLCGLMVPACWLLNKYDSKRSGTYQRNGTAFSVKENSGTLSGFLSTDNINLGHLKVENQTFAEITNMPLVSSLSIVDGVLGMAFDLLAVDNVETVFGNIFKQNLLKEPVFSFYMNRDTTTQHAGSLFLGGSNPKNYNVSTLVTLPVTSDYYWQFKVDKMMMGTRLDNITICANGCNAIIDTSTRVIAGPEVDIDAINQFLQATAVVLNRYEIPCDQINKLPKLNMTIGNRVFTMHGRDLVQQISVRGLQLCLSVFIHSTTPKLENQWFFGSAFMQRVYVIFDMGKHTLGFANTK